MESLFCCPICGGRLDRDAARYACSRGHSFDVAREGYVNLLPANRQHSKAPGDDKGMAAARTRFLDGGWYAPLRDALCTLADRGTGEAPRVLDAGCGEGWYTARLAEVLARRGGRTAGVDLSKPAVKKAAKRCPGCELAVASVYHLPVAQGSLDGVVNCFSPLAAGEFRRVLRTGGRFLYVVPGRRHLWELKQILYPMPYENDEHLEDYPGFVLEGVEPVDTTFTLPRQEDVAALFQMTPYYWKTAKEGARRLAGVERLTVSASFRIHIFRKQ